MRYNSVGRGAWPLLGVLVGAGGLCLGAGWAAYAQAGAAPAAAPESAPQVLPKWLSEAERQFLDSTGGLRPVATYDSATNLVSIKLKKVGLTPDQIFKVAIGPTYDYYRHTALVETSFRGELDGQRYLFTGTVVKALGMTVAYVPVVTQFWERRSEGHIQIEWKTPSLEIALRFVEANQARLAEVAKAAGVDEDPADYLAATLAKLPDTQSVWGQHDYYPATGYYVYQQKVKMAGKVADLIARYAGAEDITGAALKVAYQVLGEGARAGARGKEGPEVEAMNGSKIQAGP